MPETDEQAILITPGYSKDHRPDLKQAVLELMTAQDGGVPLGCQSWDGNASDHVIFQERAKALIDEFKGSPSPAFMVADSKLYTEKNAPFLAQVPFLTRLPESLQVAQQIIEPAWAWNQWDPLDDNYRFQRIDLGHYGIEQRWLVVTSQSGWEPTPDTPLQSIDKQLRVTVAIDPDKRRAQTQRKASFVLGTSIEVEEVKDEDLLPHYITQEDAPPLRANGVPDISDFFRLSLLNVRVKMCMRDYSPDDAPAMSILSNMGLP